MIINENLIYREDDEIKMFISENFNFVFDKDTRSSFSWGKTKLDNPIYNPISPEEIDLILNDDYVFDKKMINNFLNLNVEKNNRETSISCISIINVFTNNIENNEIKKLFNYFEDLKITPFLNIDYNCNFSLKNIFKLKFLGVKNIMFNFKDDLGNFTNSINLLIENDFFVKCKFNITNDNFDNVYSIINNNYPPLLLTLINFKKNFKKSKLDKLTEYLKSKNLTSVLIERNNFNRYKDYEMKSFNYKPGIDSCVIDFNIGKIYPSNENIENFVNINSVSNISNYWNSDIFNKFRKPIVTKLKQLIEKDNINE